MLSWWARVVLLSATLFGVVFLLVIAVNRTGG